MATKNKKAAPAAKKPIATKVAATKTPAAKKAVKKPAAKPVAKSENKPRKSVKKTVAVKKAAPKLKKKKELSDTIKKSSPVKKAAKTGVKKAVPKKLATTKKNAVKKPQTSVKKTAVKHDTSVKKTTSKKAPASKPAQKAAKPESSHKAELKKAIAKMKVQKAEKAKPAKSFVMPKTNTEKARKYEPEFTKSVLDQSPEEYSGPTMRYSDSELTEFKELITRKLETAKKELGYLQGLITRKDQMGGDESDNRYMTMEDGSLSMEREQLSQMASRQITFIDHLEKAMMRIENKTYGICRVTGKLIDKARLRAVPHATLSIEAKMGIAK